MMKLHSRKFLAGIALAAATTILSSPRAGLAVDLVVQGQSLVLEGKPLRGFHAVYQSTPSSQAEIEQTLDKMQNEFGLKGLTIEVGWSTIEAQHGQFWFPPTTDQILDAAHQHGMVVNIVLTPHYVPDWVYQQPGIDVHNKDPNGQNANGQWLNYAPSSPAALQWQGEFQKRAIEYYKNNPAVIGFNLTNELTYGLDSFLDYSAHAQSAWNTWRSSRGLPAATMPLPSEVSSRPQDWRQWQLFRQDQLNTYFNTTYEIARQGLGAYDHQLIFHRHQWYSASDAFASQHGLMLDPNLQYGADVIGGNVYGTSAIMTAMMQSARKPIFVTETNHPTLSDAESNTPEPGRVNKMFLEQFFSGFGNQTIYQFGGGTYFPMLDDDGSVHPSFAQFKSMAEKVDLVTEPDLTPPRQVGYVWPRNYAAANSYEFDRLGGLQRNLMQTGRRAGQAPVTVYPSFFESGQASGELMSQLDMIYALRHSGYDQATLNSTGMRDWVSAGGVLVIELDGAGAPPSWLGVGATTTSRGKFSLSSSSPFGSQTGLQRGQTGGWALTNLDQVWGTWDKPTFFSSTQNAVGVKNSGSGKVVLVGTDAITHSFEPTFGLNNWLFGNQGLNNNYEYYRVGHNVLATPVSETAAGGQVSIPQSWLGDRTFRSWIMDNQSGLFTWIDAQLSAGKYLFDVPGEHLLLISSALRGDFDADEQVDAADIDLLYQALRQGGPLSLFDVDYNRQLDQQDVAFQIETLLSTRLGDADLDQDVDLSDLGTLASHYGVLSGMSWAKGDFDGDGDVDLNDLGTLASNYGQGSAQAYADFQSLASVPEPGAAAVLAVFGLALNRRT